MSFHSKTNSDSKITDIEVIYDLYLEKLYRFFYYKGLSKENAQDLTSHTFLGLAKQMKKQVEIKDLKAYLFGIARNVFNKYLQKKYKEIPLSYFSEDFFHYVDDFLIEVDDSETVEEFALKYIEKLPEKQKIILEMRLIQKMNLKEICSKLDKDLNYVKTTQKRGIKNLKKLLAITKKT
jgi:RNA polymerase sigma-70 factor, ECF subfamily